MKEILENGTKLYNLEFARNNKKAIKTGEYRKPLEGEYYLSGANPTAYRANGNLNQKFYICKVIEVSYKRETVREYTLIK